MKNSEFLHKHRATLNKFLDAMEDDSLEVSEFLDSLTDRERAVVAQFGFLLCTLGESTQGSLAQYFLTHGFGPFAETLPGDL